MTLSLCIVGCGDYASTVAHAIHDMPEDFERFFASRDAPKPREYCEAYGGVDFYGSYEQAAIDPRIDAMYFFTPHHLHLDNALMAARHAKHVLVEKLIARSVGEAREMIHAAQDAGVKLMVAESYRFLPAVEKNKLLISEGVLGKLRLIQIHNEGYSMPTGWRTKAQLSGGGRFIDSGIHAVDILVNLAGFPDQVFALKPPQVFGQMDGEEGLVMMCHLPDGGVGLINYSDATPINERRHQVNLTCSKGEESFSLSGPELRLDAPEAEGPEGLPEGPRALRAMMREFHDSSVRNREPVMSGWEGLTDLIVVLGAYESASLKKVVSLELPSKFTDLA